MNRELADALCAASRRGLFAVGPAVARGDDGFDVVGSDRGRSLADWSRGERLHWRKALRITRKLAVALEELEARGWPAAPLSPGDVRLEPSVALLATRTLRLLTGGPPNDAPAALRWSAPEVLEGQPWDAAASRYFLGLVAYRLIAGDLPSRAGGLRAELSSRAECGVAPFVEAVARELAPGVETAILSWAGAAAARPATAGDFVSACDRLLRGEPSADVPETRSSPPRSFAPRAPATAPKARWVAAAAPLVFAAFTAASALLWPRESPRSQYVQDARAEIDATSPESCAPCHAREVVEWRRSVMSQASSSPLFGALESVVEEQVGKDDACPNGAGALRVAETNACIDSKTGVSKTGSGGEQWCVNCHAPGANVVSRRAGWNAFGDARSRAPLRDVLPQVALQGVSCVSCHRISGPVASHGADRGAYEGNATWTSSATGIAYLSRPEDGEGLRGIANSGYRLSGALLAPATPTFARLAPHSEPPASARAYLRSSEFCGACHDVRLFGTDALGQAQGEHFKRLRNAYSEWRTWSEGEARRGRTAASCQGCHMSRYPGVCVPATGNVAADPDCPPGTRFESRPPSDAREARTHYFTSVDLPLAPDYPGAFVSDRTLDAFGTPLGLRARRNILLKRTFRFGLGEVLREGSRLSIPVELENVGAGHRVPAGFSQEREIWVELRVTDARGATVYEVGVVARDDEDLHDKSFETINVDDAERDESGRPLGVFGADVRDGVDAPRWLPDGASVDAFRGNGLVNLQNGFLRCVRCIGSVDASGACMATAGQDRLRAGRFADGDYDLDTGACRSNLSGERALFETYFPVGSLDARRGIAKAPDAIIDTRSAPPGAPRTYRYELDTGAHPGPLKVTARLRFRAFPPYLVRAFADYEALSNARGLRPGGPQVARSMLARVDIVDLASAEASVR